MDSITHIALGAAIGDAQLGRKIGYKAALWGAALSTLPDLDVLLNPFIDSAAQLRIHRGLTHSFFFMFAASPILGLLINRIHRADDLGWKPWAWLSFWCLLAHILIDIPTSYGTQAFEPFSNMQVTTDSLFIIDPFFTAPIIAGVIVAQTLDRKSVYRKWASRISIIWAGFYIIWGLGVKAHVNHVFDQSFQEQYGQYERLKTQPGPFSTLMWMGYVERSDSIYGSTYSLFDEHRNLQFRGIAKNSHLVEPYIGNRPVDTLLWFSMDTYKMEEREGGLYLHDLRFGRSDFWLTEGAEFIWSNRFIFNEDSTRVVDFERAIPIIDASVENRRQLWERFWGVHPEEQRE